MEDLFSADELLRMYRALLMPRLVEERMLLALRKGIISKWFSGNWSGGDISWVYSCS